MTSTRFDPHLPYLVREKAFQEDVNVVAAIPRERFDQAINAVAAERVLLKNSDLAAVLEPCLSDEEAEPLGRFLLFLNRNSDEDERQEFAKALIEVFETRMEQLPAETQRELADRVRAMAAPLPAISAMVKAKALSTATGRQLRDAAFITDRRPVFDDGRNQVLGYLTVTTLHLDVQGMEGGLDIALSDDELSDIGEKVERALRKASSLSGKGTN